MKFKVFIGTHLIFLDPIVYANLDLSVLVY